MSTNELVEASRTGDIERVRVLLDNGADVNSNESNDVGDTPLIVASKKGNLELVRLLLERGADVNKPNNNQNAPLHVASMWIQLDIIRVLLENGADINKANNSGFTPLHYATMRGDVNTVRLLLENGADITKKDKNGKDAFYIARFKGYLEIMELIAARSNRVNITNIPHALLPEGAPSRCLDPITMNDEVNIKTTRKTTFYIQNQHGEIVKAVCVGDEYLNLIKTHEDRLFYRIVYGKEYIRQLALESLMCVKEAYVQLLSPGKKYILAPSENVGELFRDGSRHPAQIANTTTLYNVFEVNMPTPTRRPTRRSAKRVNKQRKMRRATRRQRI